VGLLLKRKKLNWSGITLQKAKIKLEWYYSPKGKNLTSGITPQKAKIKLEWEYSPKGKY
jgi:hypothetical protein